MSQWYYEANKETHGPFSLDELRYLARRGQLTRRHRVRKGESGQWFGAAGIPGLLSQSHSGGASVVSDSDHSEAAGRLAGSVARFRATTLQPTETRSLEPGAGPNSEPKVAPSVSSRRPVRPVVPPAPPRPTDSRRKWLIASVTAAAFLILLVALILWLFRQSPGGLGSGESSFAGSGATGNGSGEGNGGRPSGKAASPGDSQDSGQSTGQGANGGSGNSQAGGQDGGPGSSGGPDPGATSTNHVAVTSTSSQSALDGDSAPDNYRSQFAIGGSEFFGVTATGKRFVYIIDSSGSMAGARFDKARDELIRSLYALEDDREFCVIFFSTTTSPMFGSPKLLPATAANKTRVEEWVQQFAVNGGTDPDEAIRMALKERPDAIFLLTDGEFDSSAVVTARTLNTRRITINTIGFEDPGGEVNLKQLAADSGGKYRFVP
jgi:Mg-chelatase subunit ChlD